MAEYSYYAVCNVDGPVSIHLSNDSAQDAIAMFHWAHNRKFVERKLIEAEDDVIMYDCAGMDEFEFSVILEEHGFEKVRDLGPAVGPNGVPYPSRWTLWRVRINK